MINFLQEYYLQSKHSKIIVKFAMINCALALNKNILIVCTNPNQEIIDLQKRYPNVKMKIDDFSVLIEGRKSK